MQGRLAAEESAMPRRAAKPEPKFHIPPKGERCEQVEQPTRAFHARSLRWTLVGGVYRKVGCPKRKGGPDHPRTKAGRTVYLPRAERACRYADNERLKAGLETSVVVKARARGAACPVGYRRG